MVSVNETNNYSKSIFSLVLKNIFSISECFSTQMFQKLFLPECYPYENDFSYVTFWAIWKISKYENFQVSYLTSDFFYPTLEY